jgi:hypothetical protein
MCRRNGRGGLTAGEAGAVGTIGLLGHVPEQESSLIGQSDSLMRL